jgi:DNA invertase Pin-like site-specific DNA recombinase
MRVVLYCRVSTQEQSDKGVSLEAQESKLRAYAALYDLDIVETIKDAGESGKSLNRAGLQRALSMLRRGEADAIAVLKLDRLTRSISDWQTLIDGYFGERAGKQLFSVSDSIDTRTAAGRLVLNVLLSVAQWERETTGERTKTALQFKIQRKERVGKVRFGWDLAADEVSLIPNAAEQAAIRLMQELRTAGRTLRAIAAELTARGIATKEGLATWSHQTVGYILKHDRVAA